MPTDVETPIAEYDNDDWTDTTNLVEGSTETEETDTAEQDITNLVEGNTDTEETNTDWTDTTNPVEGSTETEEANTVEQDVEVPVAETPTSDVSDSYELTVTATDANGSSSNATVIINDPLQVTPTTAPFTIDSTEISFFEGIAYGEHDKNKFDLFLPETASTDNPVPLAIFIHGGAYVKGDKNEAYSNNDVINNSNITDFLDSGIAFASINYRFLQDQDQGVLGSLLDGSKALQFIRHNADTLMIDPSNIVLLGESAGAYISTFIALSDDMADLNTDTASSESTKPLAVYAIDTQSTLNASLWDGLVFHDVKGDFSLNSIPIEYKELFEAMRLDTTEEINSVDILQLMDKDDPRIYIENTNDSALSPLDSGDYESSLFHHPFHVRAIKEKSDTIDDFSILYKYNDINNVVITNTTESGYDFLINILSSAPLIGDIVGTESFDILSSDTEANLIQLKDGGDIVTLVADSVWSSGYIAKNVNNSDSIGTGQSVNLNGLNKFSDVIDGGADVDTLNLTTTNDAFFIDDVYSDTHTSLNDSLVSTTQGIDSIARIANLEVINAGNGNDIVDLTSANFILANAIEINGGAGNDVLWGSNGDDTINGGEGNDTIFGGTGDDTLTGGNGNDIFQFTATAGSDTIADFNLTDDSIELYFRDVDNNTADSLNLDNGVLTWDVDNTNNDVTIKLSNTITSSETLDDLNVFFVEIV